MKRMLCFFFAAALLLAGIAHGEGVSGQSTPAWPMVGEDFLFGSYEQDNNPDNGPEPLEWHVAAGYMLAGSEQYLLIAKNAIDQKLFHEGAAWDNVSWEGSSLRAWLNNDFLNTAFSAEEQAAIISTQNVVNMKDDAELDDCVFLLSTGEVRMFLMPEYRNAELTPYAAAQTNASIVNGWWLRNTSDGMADYVDNAGNVLLASAGQAYGSVRPAVWIDRKKLAPVVTPQPTTVPAPTANPQPIITPAPVYNAPAVPEPLAYKTQSDFRIDFGGDGSLETVSIYREEESGMEGVINCVLEIADAEGNILAREILVDYYSESGQDNDFGDILVQIYCTDRSHIYVESMFHFEGTRVDYRYYAWNNNRLVCEKAIENPAYSDGEGMVDLLTGNELFYVGWDEETYGLYDNHMDALNGEFGGYGINFEERVYSFDSIGAYQEKITEDDTIETAVFDPKLLLYRAKRRDIPFKEPEASVSGPVVAESAYEDAQRFYLPADAAQFGDSISDAVYIEGGLANVRSGPSLDYDILDSLENGSIAVYLGKTETDDRGVDWYYVNFKRVTGWVSSKYARLD